MTFQVKIRFWGICICHIELDGFPGLFNWDLWQYHINEYHINECDILVLYNVSTFAKSIKPAFSKWPKMWCYRILHGEKFIWSIKKAIGFYCNRVQKKFIDMDSESTLELTFKNQVLVKFGEVSKNIWN